ncbi:MAG: cytochrome c biogenesis protein CcsA [Actinobacteria bacterium]|nr:cytochrome c biogenesis protein CcsA [Actinomycetota bacterium]
MRKSSLILASIGTLLLLTGIYLAFFVTPEIVVRIEGEEVAQFSQKIFYFHVPVAWVSLLFFIIGGIFGIMFLIKFLIKREQSYDQKGYAAVEIGFLFGILVMITGVLWTRADWSVWWDWDPRLTTYLILMLVYAGYFALRSSVQEDSTKARFSAVYAIIAAINVPLTFWAGRLEALKPVHPVVFKISGASMEGPMLAAFLVSMLGMTLFAFSLFLMRLDLLRASEELDYLKEQVEVV